MCSRSFSTPSTILWSPSEQSIPNNLHNRRSTYVYCHRNPCVRSCSSCPRLCPLKAQVSAVSTVVTLCSQFANTNLESSLLHMIKAKRTVLDGVGGVQIAKLRPLPSTLLTSDKGSDIFPCTSYRLQRPQCLIQVLRVLNTMIMRFFGRRKLERGRAFDNLTLTVTTDIDRFGTVP